MNSRIELFAIILILQAIIGFTANPQDCFENRPKNELEKMQLMHLPQMARTQPASDILNCYLEASHIGDTSVTKQYLNVFTKIDEFKQNDFESFNDRQLSVLNSLGLPYDLEAPLKEILKTGNKSQIKRRLLETQDAISTKIQLTDNYKDFKNGISMKLMPTRR